MDGAENSNRHWKKPTLEIKCYTQEEEEQEQEQEREEEQEQEEEEETEQEQEEQCETAIYRSSMCFSYAR